MFRERDINSFFVHSEWQPILTKYFDSQNVKYINHRNYLNETVYFNLSEIWISQTCIYNFKGIQTI